MATNSELKGTVVWGGSIALEAVNANVGGVVGSKHDDAVTSNVFGVLLPLRRSRQRLQQHEAVM